MKEYTFGVDIDNVILQTVGRWVELLNQIRGTNYTLLDVTSYDIGKIFGVKGKQIVDMFASIDDRGSELIDPNCPAVIDNLRDEGFQIELVTAHIPHVLYGQDDLLDALNKYKINYDRISFVNVKDHTAKGKLAKHFDYMIDDAPHHIDAIGDFTKAILYEQPYNIYTTVKKAWKIVPTWSRLEHILLDDIKI